MLGRRGERETFEAVMIGNEFGSDLYQIVHFRLDCNLPLALFLTRIMRLLTIVVDEYKQSRIYSSRLSAELLCTCVTKRSKLIVMSKVVLV